jgi:CRP-like cAMP-binding protein
MTLAQIVAAMQEVKPRFLEGLTPAELKAVLSAGTVRRFVANSVMATEGDSAGHFYMLLTGRARCFSITPDGQKLLLLWLPAGEIFGAAAFLSKPQQYLVSTEAVRSCSIMVWDRSIIRELNQRYPRLVENALLIMFDYLVLYRAVHTSLVCHTAGQRLARVLSNLATGIGHKVPDGVELDVKNDELANEANVTPFTASRLISKWQRKGIVVKTRGKLLVRSPEQLAMQEA